MDGGSGFFETIVDDLCGITSEKTINLKMDADVALLGYKERIFVRMDTPS
jgi:hypothetical protein